ncbi:MAG TPA: HAD hydrolase-like protein, partial [Prolixibacteraceae bacterium]|nr:HAD hydrolase-like protein [Prolixibacteraceae bacterium]
MHIKACLFDLDGVIVDTAKYHYLAWKELAERLGFEFTEAQNERLKGVSRMASLNILLEIGNIRASETEKIQMTNNKNKRYLEFIEQMQPDEILP